MTQTLDVPSQLAAPSNLTAYGKNYVTVMSIKQSAVANNGFTLTVVTDLPCQLDCVWTGGRMMPAPQPTGTVSDGGAATIHTFVVATGTYPGSVFNMDVHLNPADSSGLIFRPVQYSVQLIGARTGGLQGSAPVRFYNYGGTPPPPAHGGGGASPPYPGNGNWNSYAWGQYAPKRTAYPN